MPQILPGNPTFAQQLLPQINQSLGQVLQGVQKGASNSADQSAFDKIANLPSESTWQQKVGALQGLSADKLKYLSPILGNIINNGGEQSAKAQEKSKETESIQNSFDSLEQNTELASRGGIHPIKRLKSEFAKGSDYSQVASDYDSTGFFLTDKLFTHFNKGTISKDKLKLVQDLSPNSKLSQSQNKGRIQALKRLFDLPSDASSEKFNKELAVAQREIKTDNSTKERPPLSDFNG